MASEWRIDAIRTGIVMSSRSVLVNGPDAAFVINIAAGVLTLRLCAAGPELRADGIATILCAGGWVPDRHRYIQHTGFGLAMSSRDPRNGAAGGRWRWRQKGWQS